MAAGGLVKTQVKQLQVALIAKMMSMLYEEKYKEKWWNSKVQLVEHNN